MKPNALLLLLMSCGTSFVVATWMFTLGYGLWAAFCIYALGGALVMMVTTALVALPDNLPMIAAGMRLDVLGNPAGTAYRLIRFRDR